MTRLQLLGIAGLLAFSAGLVGFGVLASERVPYLVEHGEARWIAAPLPVDAALHHAGPSHATGAVFTRRFSTGAPDETTNWGLTLRALGTARVFLDGERVLGEVRDPQAESAAVSASGWPCLKRACGAELELAGGDHRLRIEVANDRGPPLLWLQLTPLAAVDAQPLHTDTRWSVAPLRKGAQRVAAELADDTRPWSLDEDAPRPIASLLADAPLLAGALVFFALTSFALGRSGRLAAAPLWLPKAALGAVGLIWLVFFVAKLSVIPLRTGFDVQGHLEYVRFLIEQHALPGASDGWSMYHPPGFHLVVSALVSVFDPTSDGVAERLLYRALPLLCGLGQAGIALALARQLFAGDVWVQSTSVLFAGLLPINLMSAAYFSNESGFALLAGLAILACVRLMLAEDRSAEGRTLLRAHVWIGFWFGLALLTKYTAWTVLPVVCAFLAFHHWQGRGTSLLRAVGLSLGVTAVALALSGWVYLRNWLLFGDPLVWNIDVGGAPVYWNHPGFHTAAHFTRFGAVLSEPFYVSFRSLWDGLYSTFWGDGMVAGFVSFRSRPQAWDWSRMAAGYLLALPLVALLVLGFALSVRDALRGADLSRRCVLAMLTTLIYMFVLGTVWKSLSFAFWTFDKASYALYLAAPLAVVFARGAVSVDRRLATGDPAWPRAVARALVHAWLATWGLWVVLTYVA